MAEPTPPFEPYIAPETQMRELSVRSLVLGTVLGMVFGASSLYLALKVGLTVSASIPVAVISISVFRALHRLGAKDATILENNIVQTAGSAGESIAFGVAVTMPAIMILGFDLEVTRVMLVSVLGGLLGILMMIPLRRALIVKQHGVLKYPEGTACAEVLKAGASEESKAAASPAARGAMRGDADDLANPGRVIFAGLGLGFLFKSAMDVLRAWRASPEHAFGAPLKGGSVAMDLAPELLGVGYIIGLRIASIMCAGGVMAYLLLIPLIKFFGEGVPDVIAPGTVPIREMSAHAIRNAYVLYIGAGAVTAGGIVSLVRSFPTIWSGLKEGLRDVGAAKGDKATDSHRTDRDLPTKFVGIGTILLLAAISLAPQLHMNLAGALMIALFGFLFVTVSSRLTGEIGSSSNPISGMTVATLLFTCLVFLALGWTGRPYYVTALSVGAIVCIAASNGGTTSQDLKTGFLVGATPRLQQIAILLGAFGSALLLGFVLLRLNESATVYVPVSQLAPEGFTVNGAELGESETLSGPQAKDDGHTYRVYQKNDDLGAPAGKYLVDPTSNEAVWLVDPGINGRYDTRPDGTKVQKFEAPKATLMSYIIKGILDRQLPWELVTFGAMIALILEMSGIPSLAFAVGVYLPISVSTPIFVGGVVRYLVDRKRRKALEGQALTEEQLVAEGDKSPGVLLSSGYIAGSTIAGILIAFSAAVLTDLDTKLAAWAEAHNPLFAGPHADLLSLIPFAGLTVFLYLVGRELVMRGKKA